MYNVHVYNYSVSTLCVYINCMNGVLYVRQSLDLERQRKQDGVTWIIRILSREL